MEEDIAFTITDITVVTKPHQQNISIPILDIAMDILDIKLE